MKTPRSRALRDAALSGIGAFLGALRLASDPRGTHPG
jgi:hypothetical protein